MKTKTTLLLNLRLLESLPTALTLNDEGYRVDWHRGKIPDRLQANLEDHLDTRHGMTALTTIDSKTVTTVIALDLLGTYHSEPS